MRSWLTTSPIVDSLRKGCVVQSAGLGCKCKERASFVISSDDARRDSGQGRLDDPLGMSHRVAQSPFVRDVPWV